MNQTKKILVAYTTNSGSTAEVAECIGEELGKGGTHVEVRRLEEVTSISQYSAVVVGAPMIMGWHRAAVKFVRKHRHELSRVPVAYFYTAMSLTRLDETKIETIPVSVDPLLAKAPKNTKRLSFRESYTTVKNYLWPVLRAAPSVKPVNVGFFGGKLEMVRLKWFQILFVLFIIQAKPGGAHNLAFIREWAENISSELSAGEPA